MPKEPKQDWDNFDLFADDMDDFEEDVPLGDDFKEGDDGTLEDPDKDETEFFD